MRTLSTLGLAVSIGLLPLAAPGADWPQWGGPNRDGISPEKGLLKTWPKDGPTLAWTCKVAGTGYTAPAVVGGKVYLAGARQGTEFLIALDRGGKELWATPIGPVYDFKGNTWVNGPNGTPSVAGDSIVVLGSQGMLLCADLAGKQRWLKNLPADLSAQVNPEGGGPANMGWGFAWSPLIDSGQVLITPGGPKGLFAALDLKTGNVLWQSKEVTDQATYVSPMLAEIGGVKQVVTMVQDGAVAVSAKDGSPLWRYRRESPYPDILASPLVIKGNQIYLTAGAGGGATLVEVTANGGRFTAKEVWTNKEIANMLGGVVLVDGFLYGSHEDRSWECQEWATGTIKWASPRRGLEVGSVIYADGNLYCQGEKGAVGLLEASPEKYVQKGKFTLPQQSALRKSRGKVWTHPVLSDGLLYLRDQELVFCYKVK